MIKLHLVSTANFFFVPFPWIYATSFLIHYKINMKFYGSDCNIIYAVDVSCEGGGNKITLHMIACFAQINVIYLSIQESFWKIITEMFDRIWGEVFRFCVKLCPKKFHKRNLKKSFLMTIFPYIFGNGCKRKSISK